MGKKSKQFKIEYPSGDAEYPQFSTGVATEVSQLIDPDEIVTDRESITINFDYPLAKRVSFPFSKRRKSAGFTRREFYKCVVEGYQRIYREEEEAVGDPGHIPGMLNRQRSSGPYGIWGHDIGDLVIEGVRDNGNGSFDLIMGS